MTRTSADCIACLVRQAGEALALAGTDPDLRDKVMRRVLQELAWCSWSTSPPQLAQAVHRIIRQETGIADPYHVMKEDMNAMALELLPSLRVRVQQHPDPREAAVRVAIGGNLLDAGAKTGVTADRLAEHLELLWTRPLTGDADALFQQAARARRILYLADNAGEIVFDRLLIERLPHDRVTVYVRGNPVINDATRADAEVAGLPGLVDVRDNGSDAPGTLVDDCSDDFQQAFRSADMIIAKGQGNWESLASIGRGVHFLFIVKCQLVAQDTGSPVGALVIRRQ